MSVGSCIEAIFVARDETTRSRVNFVPNLRCLASVALAALVFLAAGFALGGARATSLTTIHSFTGGADGSDPTTGLVVGPGGALYGANNSVVYELTQNLDLTWSVTPV